MQHDLLKPHHTMLGCVLLMLICGCGTRVDLNKAQATVKVALEKWKEGGTPTQLTNQSIDITDPDWNAGFKLLDFQVKNASEQPQQGPRVVVVLNLQDRAGRKVHREVAYEVISGDRVRIGRDAFHIEW